MKVITLTQLSALARGLQQQPQLIQDQRHVHRMTPKSLNAKQERHRSLKLSSQEQHLEIQERLLAGREMGLSCWTKGEREGVGLDETEKNVTIKTFMKFWGFCIT